MKYFYLLIASLFIIQACDDNSSGGMNTHFEHNYLPFSLGSYWIFDCYNIDTHKNIIYNSRTTDSLVVEKEESSSDGKIYTMVNYINGQKEKTYLYKKVNYDLYIKGLVADSTELLKDEWMLIFDSKHNTTWNLAQLNFPISYKLNDSLCDFNFNLNVNGYYIGIYKTFFNADSVKTINFKFNRGYAYSKTIKIDDFTNVLVQTFKMRKLQLYFAENIGFFSFYEEPFNITTKHTPTGLYPNKYPTTANNGKKSTLIRYRLLK